MPPPMCPARRDSHIRTGGMNITTEREQIPRRRHRELPTAGAIGAGRGGDRAPDRAEHGRQSDEVQAVLELRQTRQLPLRTRMPQRPCMGRLRERLSYGDVTRYAYGYGRPQEGHALRAARLQGNGIFRIFFRGVATPSTPAPPPLLARQSRRGER